MFFGYLALPRQLRGHCERDPLLFLDSVQVTCRNVIVIIIFIVGLLDLALVVGTLAVVNRLDDISLFAIRVPVNFSAGILTVVVQLQERVGINITGPQTIRASCRLSYFFTSKQNILTLVPSYLFCILSML